jgi:hypothetical protein
MKENRSAVRASLPTTAKRPKRKKRKKPFHEARPKSGTALLNKRLQGITEETSQTTDQSNNNNDNAIGNTNVDRNVIGVGNAQDDLCVMLKNRISDKPLCEGTSCIVWSVSQSTLLYPWIRQVALLFPIPS